MEDQENIKNNIVAVSDRIFKLGGVRSATMSDIAKELGMSKKTLYQYFSNKEEIVEEVVRRSLDRDKELFDRIWEESENPVEKIVRSFQKLTEMIKEVNPVFYSDLKKLYHNVDKEMICCHKYEFVMERIIKMLEDGKEQGYFRQDVSPEIVGRLHIEISELIFSRGAGLVEFDITELLYQYRELFLFGILSQKGREYYKELTN
ncbi:TetR family transcriptional regulator [Aureibacter tunicatorum]|nr:TetR family transcriptional regulator [Aureibacter tunicatorum]